VSISAIFGETMTSVNVHVPYVHIVYSIIYTVQYSTVQYNGSPTVHTYMYKYMLHIPYYVYMYICDDSTNIYTRYSKRSPAYLI
jgi:hypothetical protein